MNRNNNEEFFVNLVRDGVLEYRDDGTFWWKQYRKRGGDRSGFVDADSRADHKTRIGYMQLMRRWKPYGRIIAMSHRVAWVLCNGAIPESFEVNHLDGDKSNNRIGNLEIVTKAENMKHAYKTGLMKPNRSGAKLTDDDVREIRKRLSEGESQGQIANDYPVNRRAISFINTGVYWGDVQ